MDILTKTGRVLNISTEHQEVHEVKNKVSFYKRTEEYEVTQYGAYLEVNSKKINIKVSIYREIRDVFILKDKIILVGDNWMELFSGEKLEKEKEFKEPIIDVKSVKGLLMVLFREKLSIISPSLKEMKKQKIQISYPEKLFVYEKEKLFIGILSATERTAYVFSSDGALVKKMKVSRKPTAALLFKKNESIFLCVANKNQLQISPLDSEKDQKTLETDHITDIFQIEYLEETEAIYSVSKEGVLCEVKLEEKEAAAVYVDQEGIERIFLQKGGSGN
ncbi:hypothetical protein NEFER03_0565 [Nematocida sp. LUAm3]|nr:hypothetical protein NEFER03_0565 [Nematocida sp. LUAm3]KAI5175532.1 hypothetical protein NEFER02_1438 [Nematocida sp. LUAm2]KAI5178438.1 hypothetical protein NEFER01_1585 [Nematocida sp. LUAm1]